MCRYYNICATRSAEQVLEQLRMLPRCDLSLCKCEDDDADEEDEEDLNNRYLLGSKLTYIETPKNIGI